MTFGNDNTGIQISKKRLNGLKLRALADKRTIAAELDFLLEKAAISELTDEELKRELRKEIPA